MNFIKKNKLNALLILSLFIFSLLLIFSPFSFEKLARAFSGNYDRTTDNSIDLQDWNWLDDDFLFRDGNNTMDGDLDMAGHRVTNLDTPAPTDLNHGATVKYVEDAISVATAGGGDTFVNWGDNTCPAGTDLLYSGSAFSAKYDSFSGGDNPVCIQSGNSGGAFSGTYGDNMYPLATGNNSNDLPPGFAVDSVIQCALCHKPAGTCFEYMGRSDCGTSGFNPLYSGYILGSHSNADSSDGLHHNSTQRLCVNDNFNSSIGSGGNLGALWYGTIIENNFSLDVYTENSFIKCSVCCN